MIASAALQPLTTNGTPSIPPRAPLPAMCGKSATMHEVEERGHFMKQQVVS